jgi:hypothetical protein
MTNGTPTPTRRPAAAHGPTAADAYAAKREQVRSLMAELEHELTVHGAAFEADSTSWGYPGDLDVVRDCLRDALDFLSSQSA